MIERKWYGDDEDRLVGSSLFIKTTCVEYPSLHPPIHLIIHLQAIHPSTHLQRLCFKPNILFLLLILVIFLLLLMLIIISIPTHLLPLNQL